MVLDGSLHYVQCVPYAAFLQIFLLFGMIWYFEFNCLPRPNNEMHDDTVFADRFHCQLTMFGIRVLIGLSLHLHAHIINEIDTAKIIAAFCKISHCFHDLIRLHSIVCHVQTTKCTMMWFSMIDFDINWLYLKCVYRYGYLDLWYSYCIWNNCIKKSPLVTGFLLKTIYHAGL